MVLCVHRNHEDYMGWDAQDGHLDFHTALSSDLTASVDVKQH